MYAWPTINSYKCCYFTLLVRGPVKNSTYNDRLGAQQQEQEAKVKDRSNFPGVGNIDVCVPAP